MAWLRQHLTARMAVLFAFLVASGTAAQELQHFNPAVLGKRADHQIQLLLPVEGEAVKPIGILSHMEDGRYTSFTLNYPADQISSRQAEASLNSRYGDHAVKAAIFRDFAVWRDDERDIAVQMTQVNDAIQVTYVAMDDPGSKLLTRLKESGKHGVLMKRARALVKGDNHGIAPSATSSVPLHFAMKKGKYADLFECQGSQRHVFAARRAQQISVRVLQINKNGKTTEETRWVWNELPDKVIGEIEIVKEYHGSTPKMSRSPIIINWTSRISLRTPGNGEESKNLPPTTQNGDTRWGAGGSLGSSMSPPGADAATKPREVPRDKQIIVLRSVNNALEKQKDKGISSLEELQTLAKKKQIPYWVVLFQWQ